MLDNHMCSGCSFFLLSRWKSIHLHYKEVFSHQWCFAHPINRIELFYLKKMMNTLLPLVLGWRNWSEDASPTRKKKKGRCHGWPCLLSDPNSYPAILWPLSVQPEDQQHCDLRACWKFRPLGSHHICQTLALNRALWGSLELEKHMLLSITWSWMTA